MIIQKQTIICRILPKVVKDSYEFNRQNCLFCLLFLTTTSRFCVSVVYGESHFVLEMYHIKSIILLQIWIRYCVQVTSTTMHSCLTRVVDSPTLHISQQCWTKLLTFRTYWTASLLVNSPNYQRKDIVEHNTIRLIALSELVHVTYESLLNDSRLVPSFSLRSFFVNG